MAASIEERRHLSDILSFFFQAEDGIRDLTVTGVQTCALPICELTQLAIALDQASVGRPTTVLVAGSSGIGVSRLLTEAQQRLAGMSEPFTVVQIGRASCRERV